jgi:capsular polysaccharide biosynthesis protein
VACRVGALVGEPGGSRRIYFSRANAPRRRAANEAEVVRLLRAHDFEILRIDPAKPEEQVRASLGARVIAGVHGAELTNLLFMPPGGEVLEFRHGHDEVFVDCYGQLSEIMGHRHRPHIAAPTEHAPGWEINYADVVVDLDVLRESLHAIQR